MNYREIIYSMLRSTPPTFRRRFKYLYEQRPSFGRKWYFATYGEDAFLQKYFSQKTLLSSPEEMRLSGFLRKTIGHGYYVDVGAYAPIQYSTTYWFYRHGWSGINIDASPGSSREFRKHRPRDINLEALVSDQEMEMTYYYWDTPFDVNTTSQEHEAYFALQTGRDPAKITLQSRRLESLLAEHLPSNQAISFMTIDVEGHDLHVLRSNNWDRFRPELVLVEDFSMNGDAPSSSDIYRFIRSVGYEMYAWLRPTVVYRQVGLRDWLVPDYD